MRRVNPELLAKANPNLKQLESLHDERTEMNRPPLAGDSIPEGLHRGDHETRSRLFRAAPGAKVLPKKLTCLREVSEELWPICCARSLILGWLS